MVKDSRFTAWHFAATGTPVERLRYRLMCTFQRGLGTYRYPYAHPRNNVSLLAEAEYEFPHDSQLKGMAVKGSFGMDRGSLDWRLAVRREE